MTRRFVRIAAAVSTSLAAVLAGCSKSAEQTPTAAAPNSPSSAAVPEGVRTASAQVASGNAFEQYQNRPTTNLNPSGVRQAQHVELPNPVVVMKTSLGEIHLKLNQKAAPRTVSNFVDYVVTKHYDNTIFHQIEGGYVALGGTYDEKLRSKTVRYPIPNESANGLKNLKGTIAMSRDPADPNSATSQFFINLADNPSLDRKGDKPEEAGFCVFGEVTQGLDVVQKLAEVQTAKVSGFEKMPVQTVTVQTMKLMR